MRKSPRYLRITWTVFCGIACVLMIALWVRSYSSSGDIRLSFGHEIKFVVVSERGRLSVSRVAGETTQDEVESFARRVVKLVNVQPVDRNGKRLPIPPGLRLSSNDATMSAPHRATLPVMLAFATLPWIRWRFTLRTLLIATTLVALVLGLVVWAAR